MKRTSTFNGLRAVAVSFVAALFLASAWASDHESVLYNFGAAPGDGGQPAGGLIMDSAHNFYGATYQGGSYCQVGCGTVFKLSPGPGGTWTETVLHNFGNGQDGTGPNGTLVMDAAGNLYGLTYTGGIFDGGIVFELTPNQDGGWSETVLHNFGSGSDGSFATAALLLDAAGNLYGMTFYGGAYGGGTVFELSPTLGGGWAESVLYSFGHGTDGAAPDGGLIMDAAGNLYGTTLQGGEGGGYCQASGCGTVFELSPSAGGGWTETVLHSFNANDGSQPNAAPVMDGAGRLYGTTFQGGNLTGQNCAPFGCGSVFELSPNPGGGWSETTLYNFNGQPDAGYPQSSLILDAVGNLYGATTQGGSQNNGTVFELSSRHGTWTEIVLFSFSQVGTGVDPVSAPILDRTGNLYGMTELGGEYYGGLVYALTSPAIRPAASAER